MIDYYITNMIEYFIFIILLNKISEVSLRPYFSNKAKLKIKC